MRTNKERLRALMQEHLDNMKTDITKRMKKVMGNDDWYINSFIKSYDTVLINAYDSCIDWVSVFEHTDIAWVKPDIIEKSHAVSVGLDYYGSCQPLPYRCLSENQFQVLHGGVWVDASRRDWDLSDKVCTSKDDMSFIDEEDKESADARDAKELSEKAKAALNFAKGVLK